MKITRMRKDGIYQTYHLRPNVGVRTIQKNPLIEVTTLKDGTQIVSLTNNKDNDRRLKVLTQDAYMDKRMQTSLVKHWIRFYKDVGTRLTPRRHKWR